MVQQFSLLGQNVGFLRTYEYIQFNIEIISFNLRTIFDSDIGVFVYITQAFVILMVYQINHLITVRI